MIITSSVTDLDLPDLQPYRTLRQSVAQFRRGLFVAEGEKVVRRLIDSPLLIVSVLLTPEWLKTLQPALEKRSEHIATFVAARALLEQIVGFHLHQGIMAVGRVPAALRVTDLLDFPAPRLYVALDGLTNSENVGVLVRNCAAFGTQALLAGETCSSPYLRRAVRNSMGAVFNLPVLHSQHLTDDLRTLGENGFRVIAAHPHAEGRMLSEVDCRGDVCVVFGSEGAGISRGVLAVCHDAVAVPMQHGVDSLNVASAAAVFLYEIDRQRRST